MQWYRYYRHALPAAMMLGLALLFLLPAPSPAGSPADERHENPAGERLHSRQMEPEGHSTWRGDPDRVIHDGRNLHPWAYPYAPYPYTCCHPCRGCPERHCRPCPDGRYIHPQFFEPAPHWYQKEMPAAAGRLSILVDPLHARVTVDGHLLERKADLAYEAGLLTGEYQVEVSADGYTTDRSSVEIRTGEVVRLAVRLEPSDGEQPTR